MAKFNLMVPRDVYMPMAYPWAYDAFLLSEQSHWMGREVPMLDDVDDWNNKLTEAKRDFLTKNLRFFVQSDIMVSQGYTDLYLPMFKHPEIRMMLSSFAARECFDDKTEVLTNKGWKLFKDVSKSDLVAQFDVKSKEISFDIPTDYIEKEYNGPMHHYDSKRTDICVTPKHRMLVIHPYTRKYMFAESESGIWGRNYLYRVNGKVSNKPSELSVLERLMIAIQADGCLKYANTCDESRMNDMSVSFKLTKKRKISKLISYLKELGLNCNPLVQEDGSVKFNFSLNGYMTYEQFSGIKELSFFKEIDSISTEKANSIIEELVLWDGCSIKQLCYYNTNETTIDLIQSIAVLSDYSCTKGINRPKSRFKILNNKHESDTRVCYVLTFNKQSERTYPHRKEIDYDGKVYCLTMPKGTLVVRRGGKVSIQGNCIHIDAYSYLIETLGMPETFYSEFLEIEAMKNKFEYYNDVLTQDIPFPAKLAAISAFTEGVSLFSAFAMLMNFPRHGEMNGLGQIISWSSIDETQHCEGNIKLFRQYIMENKKIWNDDLKGKIYTIATNIINQEDAFIDLMFDDNAVEDLTADELKQYIRFLGDRRLIAMGMKGIFKVKKNPLPWIEEIMNAPIHGNFFETRVTDYSKAPLKGSWADVWGSKPAMELDEELKRCSA